MGDLLTAIRHTQICGNDLAPGSIVLQAGSDGWLLFREPLAVLCATRVSEVGGVLREAEAAVSRGLYAVGFLSYEASPAFDRALLTHPAGSLPLTWFGVYERAEECFVPQPDLDAPTLEWTPAISYARYAQTIARIKHYIAEGDTYQVNYTFPLRAPFSGDTWALFQTLCRAQRAHYGAYFDIGSHVLCSASPELFFRLNGEVITCRPMKGTAPRGLTLAADDAKARWLGRSRKNRAENVMIVDMIRNDLGRIAEVGSVHVPRLFETERYETLWQMTSTVTARTHAPLTEIMAALFPCASITGAPKVRTMQIITELEDVPRGIYCGAIGYLAPGRRAQFNVAIRTVEIDREAGLAQYGAGGGIVWDSTARGEYRECLTKAEILFTVRQPFSLLETLLWKPGSGYFLLDRHLRRLEESVCYFGFVLDCSQVTEELNRAAAAFPPQRHRVRLLVDEEGGVTVESTPLARAPRKVWRVALAKHPVDIHDRYLYHKTTHRDIYTAARVGFPDCDDVILWNARGEITESTIANVVVKLDGELVTPPVKSGLLPGIYRARLLDSGRIKERIITCDDLARAEAVYLINSVRGWIPVEIPNVK